MLCYGPLCLYINLIFELVKKIHCYKSGNTVLLLYLTLHAGIFVRINQVEHYCPLELVL